MCAWVFVGMPAAVDLGSPRSFARPSRCPQVSSRPVRGAVHPRLVEAACDLASVRYTAPGKLSQRLGSRL